MLYGSLGADFGRVHRYDVQSPAEAVKALSATLKGFKQAFIAGGYYRILIGGKSQLNKDQTDYPVSDKETIRIVPVIAGAGFLDIFEDFTNIIVGSALILGAPYLGAAAPFAASIGKALIIGGVAELLFPPPSAPESQENPENKPSFIFNGAVNTTRQGNPVPLCYGRMVVGSQVISAGLSVNQI
jgi:predicted phage tail protein